ncbi:hypothetical protein P3T37_006113 [Kitasatospora sp. MAA4]|nr:hypothetical protein [Kitasatospora sp. MAA4]
MTGQHIGGDPDRLSQQISATMPDPGEATTPQEFVRRLQAFRVWSGSPSLRELERRTSLPRSTLSGDLSHQRSRLPPLERVLALVTAFGASAEELARWQLAWQLIQLRQQSAQPPGSVQDLWIRAGRDAEGPPSRVRPPVLSVVTDDGSTQPGSLIDEIVREGARRMLAAALEAEVNQYLAELAAETDENGRPGSRSAAPPTSARTTRSTSPTRPRKPASDDGPVHQVLPQSSSETDSASVIKRVAKSWSSPDIRLT